MGQPLVTFRSQQIRNTSIAVVFGIALMSVDWFYGHSLRDPSYLSGWLLLAGMALLAIYNIRKKLPFLPLLRSASWLQVHIYVGWLVIVLFLLHTSVQFPRGPLEIVLWSLFVAVAGSGVFGILLSRTAPKRLRLEGERIIFERIPEFRAKLAAEVKDLAMRSVTETSSNTIVEYYTKRLQPYFSGPRSLLAHLLGSKGPLSRTRGEIRSLERYLNTQGKEILGEIESRVIAKDNLDYQYVSQLFMKGWLFVHIPLTYSLILVTALHVVLVYAFDGGTL